MLAASTNKEIGKPFIILNLVDSTNNYAMQLAKNALTKHGSAYFALEQTAGKGQRTKQWLSAKDENIILSVVVEPRQLLLQQQFFLNIVSALSAVDLFNKYSTDKFKIKWPNDIYCNDRKTGGILIETIINANILKYAVIGFGLNINQTVFDPSLKNSASLKQITNKEYNVIELAGELCSNLQKKYTQLVQGKTNDLLNDFNNNLYKKNEVVKLKKNARVFNAKIIKVNASGNLLVQTAIEEEFEFGSIEWLMNHS